MPVMKSNSLRQSEEVLRAQARRAQVTRDQVEASLCKADFYHFFKEFWPEFVSEEFIPNWHVRYICQQLQKAAERVFRGEAKEYDLNINISPGTGKSAACSVLFVAWVWTRMPSAAFICCSYAEKLALRLSTFTRRVVKSEKYRRLFPKVEIRSDMDTKGGFETTAGGGRYAVGSGTQVMGYHAHFIIIDDPIDPRAVLSDVELENINNWIKEQLGGRKKRKEVTVTALIMQRLHQNDPSAVMAGRRGVKNIRIPATTEYKIEPPALRKYYRDGLMDPVLLTRKYLAEVKEGPRGEYMLAGQFGQDPVPPGGGMFKTKLIKDGAGCVPPSWKARCRFWDKSGSHGQGAYTAGVLLGLDWDSRIWILDVARGQWDTFTREKMIRWYARRDGRLVQIGVEQEPGSGGKESAEGTVRRNMGYRVRVLTARGTKEMRADEVSVQVNAGNVYADKSCHWWTELVNELRYFPFSTYKDQVDALAGAFTVLCRPRVRVGGALARPPADADPRGLNNLRKGKTVSGVRMIAL